MRSSLLSPVRFCLEAYLAITDFRFYAVIFRQALARSLAYLVFLSFVTALVTTFSFAWFVLPACYDFLDWARESFPPMTIQGGRLTIEGEQPMVREYLGDQVYTFVFDTTDSHEPLHKLKEPAFVFTQDVLHVRINGQSHPWPWSQVADTRLGGAELAVLKDVLRWSYFPLGFSFFLFFALIGKGVQAVLLAVFALSASARYEMATPFANRLNIAVYSLTPAVAVDLLVTLSGQEIPYFGLIYLITAALYAYLATQKSLSGKQTPSV